jgi:tRNA1(Val) A37 N6-methylase TrmN6
MDDMMTAYVALQEAAAINAAAAAAGSPPSVAPAGGIRHTLDIGCGIGSVLLMVAWGLRRQHMEQQQQAAAQQQQQQQGAAQQQQQEQQQQQQLLASYGIQAYGVEAQAVSFQLAQRSIRYNLGSSAQQQVQVRHIKHKQTALAGLLVQKLTPVSS